MNRSNNTALMTKIELMIHDAMQEIEVWGADVRLTNAQIKLQEAKDIMSKYIDEKLKQ